MTRKIFHLGQLSPGEFVERARRRMVPRVAGSGKLSVIWVPWRLSSVNSGAGRDMVTTDFFCSSV